MTAVNDCGEFDRRFLEIYPHEPELKKEDTVYLEGLLLDHMITVKKFVQRKDRFPFSILRMVYLKK